jgi:hypothetical protein
MRLVRWSPSGERRCFFQGRSGRLGRYIKALLSWESFLSLEMLFSESRIKRITQISRRRQIGKKDVPHFESVAHLNQENPLIKKIMVQNICNFFKIFFVESIILCKFIKKIFYKMIIHL